MAAGRESRRRVPVTGGVPALRVCCPGVADNELCAVAQGFDSWASFRCIRVAKEAFARSERSGEGFAHSLRLYVRAQSHLTSADFLRSTEGLSRPSDCCEGLTRLRGTDERSGISPAVGSLGTGESGRPCPSGCSCPSRTYGASSDRSVAAGAIRSLAAATCRSNDQQATCAAPLGGRVALSVRRPLARASGRDAIVRGASS